jgi:hypothetical protein
MSKAHWNESRVSDIAGFSPDETPEDAGSRRRRVSVYEGACGCPHKTNWSVLTAARAPTPCLSTVVILLHERVEVHVPFSGTIFDHYSAMYDFHTLTWALTVVPTGFMEDAPETKGNAPCTLRLYLDGMARSCTQGSVWCVWESAGVDTRVVTTEIPDECRTCSRGARHC